MNNAVWNRDHVFGNDPLRRLVSENVNGNGATTWGYDQLGNWESYTPNGGTAETRTSNEVNEITGITRGGVTVTPSYDDVGNLTSTGEAAADGRVFTYDAWGRITDGASAPAVLAQYEYNGVHKRTVVRRDWDGGGFDSDVEYHQVYDERWRVISIYRVDISGTAVRDAEPQEHTLYHRAGLDGGGGSSPLDSVLIRYRHDDGDSSTTPSQEWLLEATSADGAPESRGYYFQNCRGESPTDLSFCI